MVHGGILNNKASDEKESPLARNRRVSVKEDRKYKKTCTGKSLLKLKKKKNSRAGADDVYQPKLSRFKRADIFLKNN